MDAFLQVPQYLKSQEEVNIDEICRVCRTSRGVMSYIFSCSGVDTSVPLSERIMDFANVKMVEGDGLPSLICHQCLYHIEKANEFKMLCEQSDALLREYLAPQAKTKEKVRLKKQEISLNGFSRAASIRSIINTSQFQLNDFRSEINVHFKEEPVESYACRASDGSDDPQCESDDGELNCPTCNKHFETNDRLNRHILIHTQDGPFPCDFCEVIENDKASLRVHWKQYHASRHSHVCQTCGESFSSKAELLKHNIHHDKTKPHHCPVCKKAFTYRSDLRKHLVIHSGLRPYHCPVCFKSFTRSTNLNKHARLHSGRKPFSCLDCDKVFASRGDLVRHSVIHTGEKPFVCSICSISFNRKDKLTRHEKLHIGERAYTCSECPTSFSRKEELTKHIQFLHYSPIMVGNDTEGSEEDEETEDVVISVDPAHWTDDQATEPVREKRQRHSKQPPVQMADTNASDPDRIFGCDVCFKRFKQRRELVRHSATHTGYRPHGCSVCGKAFARSDKLKRHMQIHTRKKKRESNQRNEKPQCTICSKVLSSKHELRRHLITHASTKPYQCSLCHHSYCRRDKLIKHIKQSHADSFNARISG